MTKKVVIFAGHDDNTWESMGAKGVKTDLLPRGVFEEYDTNILIAAGAVNILKTVPGLTVYFPQEKGRNMSLAQRVAYANEVKADFLIDVHSNASASRTATGAAAFYWHNSPNGKKAANIYAGLLKAAKLPLWQNGTYPSTPGTWSEFYMLKQSNMPGILLENFFFTTRTDLERYLLNPAVQRVLMEIVAETTVQYLGLKIPAAKPIPVSKPAAPKPAAVKKPKEEVVAAVIAPKADPNKPDIWAAKEWDAAQGLKYFDGTRPRDPISRQEAAIVAMRQQDNFEKQLAALQKSLQK